MKRETRLHYHSLILKIGGIFVAILLATALFGCSGDDNNNDNNDGNASNQQPTAQTGYLNVEVASASTEWVLTDPNGSKKTFTGNQSDIPLKEGLYTVTASGVAREIVVNADEVSTIVPPTLGSLSVNVNEDADVDLTGPNNFMEAFRGSRSFTGLTPGVYTVSALGATSEINVFVGQISSIVSTLEMPVTVGALNVNVNPASAAVVVTGPGSFSQTFKGNKLLADLAPGVYTVDGTATGFLDDTGQINVIAGLTSSIALNMQAMSIISEAPRAVYRDDKNNLIPINASHLENSEFVFYAWLQDMPEGIIPANFPATINANPGAPLDGEQRETAPSFTQNLASAWVGIKDGEGVVRPVIGADVRWEIDQYYFDRVNSMQFGTSDDNRRALDYGVFDDQADTRTNNAHLDAERFPLMATQYPLFNQTGAGTPFIDGFTWVTLFSPDRTAAGRIVAVATVDGEEIGKQILYKNFAPAPKLEITKTVDPDVVNLVNGSAASTWTVKVRNVGDGDATNVQLNDILASGAGASYSLSPPDDVTADGDGFTGSFSIDAGKTVTYTFDATVTSPGTYCNEGQILSFDDADGANTWTPVDLNAQACFTALESNLSLVKDFVAADNETTLGKSLTVEANVPARLRVRVINSGSGAASGVNVKDLLDLSYPETTGVLENYTISNISLGTENANGGFDIAPIASLAAGSSVEMLFTVAASIDGTYCDTATVTATSGTIGIDHDTACLTVATPNLTITKVDAPKNVIPSASYTSTIVVQNTGSATAKNVVITDMLGFNSVANVQAIYMSSSLNGTAGTLDNYVVTSPTVEIPAGQSLTFTVVSRIPFAAASGTYCDTATVSSSNAATKEAEDCVNVPAFSALQTQLIDLDDPIAAGSNATYFSTLYVEALSNEGVGKGELTFSFGLTNPKTLGIAGVFKVISTEVYLDAHPVIDPVTGVVVSDTANPTAVLLTEGADYTIDNSVEGKQVITMAEGIILEPDTARYIVHEVLIPSATPTNKLYTTSYIWRSVGLVDPENEYEASSSEPTTVLP